MLKIYNSLTRKTEEFIPRLNNRVNMYVCGPTVYDDIHIGNGRPVVFFDVVKRYLSYLDYDVIYASNITDIDDKIIERAKELDIKEEELSKKYSDAFFNIMERLGSRRPDMTPFATNYIEEMITYISKLIEDGFAYQTKTGVYFRVHKIKKYGQLSNQKVDDLRSGSRIDLDETKEDPIDFVLWKVTTDGLNYKSPWGMGRPGWHTECAVMNNVLFNEELDIHGGGSDLKFPHHENEIAQSMAHDHHHLAKYWMHVGRLDLSGEKMSKSLSNDLKVKTLLEKYSAGAYRLLLLAHHYRQPISYSDSLMEQYQKSYDKISYTINKWRFQFYLKGLEVVLSYEELDNQFKELMNNDFNTPLVISLIDEHLKTLNKTGDLSVLNIIESILKVFGITPVVNNPTVEDLEMYRTWEKARDAKDFKTADNLRGYLLDKGWL